MNQWYAKKKHVSVLLTLVGAILMGLVWLAGVPAIASAQQMLEQAAQASILASSLTAEKLASADVIYDGGTIDFQIVLRNSNTSPVYEVQVQDVLNSRLEVVSASAGVLGSVVTTTGEVTYTVWVVPPSGSVTLDLRARVRQGSFLLGAVITNTATISDSANLFVTEPVTFTMAEYLAPTSQIDNPWPQQLFTQRGTFSIRGRVWIGEQPVNFPATPTLNPINNNGGGSYTVSWVSNIPGDVLYELQESTRVDFATIRNTWSNLSVKLRSISSNPIGVYYYRVRAVTTLGDSRWSAARQVTVTGYAQVSALALQEPALPLLYVTSAPLAATQAPTVALSIWSSTTVPQTYIATVRPDPYGGNWWQWVYTWTLPMQNNIEYTIRSQAYNQGYSDQTLNDQVKVLINNGIRYIYLPLITRRYPPVPYGTTLNIVSNDGYGTYQLSWVYNQPGDPFAPTSYTFQEATNVDFTNPTINETRASPQSFANKAVGTYYYRVRGNNAYGVGPWSNVQTIVVSPRGFFDDFSTTVYGWPHRVFKIDNRGVLDAAYDGGYYRMKILLDKNSLNNKRLGIIPAPYNNTATNYDVEAVHRFVKAGDWAGFDPGWGHAGLVFAATKSGAGYFNTIYSVDWSFDGRCSVVKRTGIDSYTPISWLNMTNLLAPVGCPGGYIGGYDRDLIVRAEVRGSQVTVYLTYKGVTTRLGSFTDSGIGAMHQAGLATASWDYTPVQSRFDNFRVTVR